jgi:hypothetical protein
MGGIRDTLSDFDSTSKDARIRYSKPAVMRSGTSIATSKSSLGVLDEKRSRMLWRKPMEDSAWPTKADVWTLKVLEYLITLQTSITWRKQHRCCDSLIVQVRSFSNTNTGTHQPHNYTVLDFRVVHIIAAVRIIPAGMQESM